MLSDGVTVLGQLSSMGAASQQGGNPSWALGQYKKETKESATSAVGGVLLHLPSSSGQLQPR